MVCYKNTKSLLQLIESITDFYQTSMIVIAVQLRHAAQNTTLKNGFISQLVQPDIFRLIGDTDKSR